MIQFCKWIDVKICLSVFNLIINFQVWTAIWLSIVSTGFGANILIICPFFSKSLYGFHVAIARSLHTAGHQITIVHSFPEDAASENFTVIDSFLPDQRDDFSSIQIDKAIQANDILKILLWEAEAAEKDCNNVIQLEKIQVIAIITKNPSEL